jgi:hypothetical protein
VIETHSILTVQYTLRATDVYDPFQYSWRTVIRWAVVVFVVLLLYDVGPDWFSAQLGAAVQPALVIAVLVSVALFILFLLPWLRIKSTFRNYATAGRLRTISFRSEGLHLESEDLSADYKWSLFHRIVETHRAFHFIVGPRSATVLPKRSLSNSGEMQMLRQLIRENFKGKKNCALIDAIAPRYSRTTSLR